MNEVTSSLANRKGLWRQLPGQRKSRASRKEVTEGHAWVGPARRLSLSGAKGSLKSFIKLLLLNRKSPLMQRGLLLWNLAFQSFAQTWWLLWGRKLDFRIFLNPKRRKAFREAQVLNNSPLKNFTSCLAQEIWCVLIFIPPRDTQAICYPSWVPVPSVQVCSSSFWPPQDRVTEPILAPCSCLLLFLLVPLNGTEYFQGNWSFYVQVSIPHLNTDQRLEEKCHRDH